jgi:hypothetical protein
LSQFKLLWEILDVGHEEGLGRRLKQQCSVRLPGKSQMIPIFDPRPLDEDHLGPLRSAQPIIQLKELEVDRERYQVWLAWLRHRRKLGPQEQKANGPG